MSLASVADYEARFGASTEDAKIAQLLDDASSLVQQATGQNIAYVPGEVVELDVRTCSNVVFLPELPVTAVSAVVDLGPLGNAPRTLTEHTQFEWFESGKLVNLNGPWSTGPRRVRVTYTHGVDPVPGWLVSLVCTMAQRATLPWVTEGVRSESFVDAYSVSFSAPATGGSLVWITKDEADALGSLSAPMVA